MDDRIKNLKGSEKRDLFKWAHKNKMNSPFYASDADLCLIMFDPRGVVAYLDYKGSREGITETEKVLYDEWVCTKPVYIIKGEEPETGPFEVHECIFGGETEYRYSCPDWAALEKWEASIRREYKRGDK